MRGEWLPERRLRLRLRVYGIADTRRQADRRDITLSRDGDGRLDVPAVRSFSTRHPDIVSLDAGLPDIDGFTVCRWMRSEQEAIPILIVTARDSDIDVVVGLDAGANDYVIKPFSIPVILARVRTHLRASTKGDATIVIGALRADTSAHRFYLDAVSTCDPRSSSSCWSSCTTQAKSSPASGSSAKCGTCTETHHRKALHIHALRRKLLDDPETSRRISTTRGIGYRFETP